LSEDANDSAGDVNDCRFSRCYIPSHFDGAAEKNPVKPRMTFGLLYDFRNPEQWWKPWPELYADTLDFIAWTEKIGFDGAWLPEHHFADDGYLPSPLIVLSAVAARTKEIKLGSAISIAPLYHPVRFAEDCALLDIISNGRLEMHIGVGARECETAGFGVSFKARGNLTDEFLQIVRKLWAGEVVNHDGRHFSIKNARIMPRPLKGRVPLYIGGFTDKAIRRAVTYGDGLSGPVELCESYLKMMGESGSKAAFLRLRSFDMYLYVAADPARAWAELAPHVLYANNAYAKMYSEEKADFGNLALKPMSMEEFTASGKLRVLTPLQAIGHFESILAVAPIEHFMIYAPAGLPLARFAEYVDLFAREVIPAFR